LEDCGGDEEKARFKLLEPSIRYWSLYWRC
jgi:hypothetical protein